MNEEIRNDPESAQPPEMDALKSENEQLKQKLIELQSQEQRRAEKTEGLAHLQALTGASGGELYNEAVRYADESEELQALPATKRYELSYYLLLGKKANAQKSTAPPPPPLFAASRGSSDAPGMSYKAPTTLEKAKENAKKYFGIQ